MPRKTQTLEVNKIYLGDCIATMQSWPENFVDAIVTDPPYGIRFMGEAWDGEDIDKMIASKLRKGTENPARPGYTHQNRAAAAGTYNLAPEGMLAFQTWTAAWAREALRVLKPGGHLLSFASTRTYHRMAAGIEDAGFEVRDQLSWLYSSGFPKSLNVSMALDKMDGGETRRVRALRFTSWMRSTGITAAQVNAATASNMASHYLTEKEQPSVATADMFDRLRPLLPAVPEDIEELVRWRTIESENFKRRAVVGMEKMTDTKKVRLGFAGATYNAAEDVGATRQVAITKAHTPLAQEWEGWGTALKPAQEPICLARKPLDENIVADNVAKWGAGALNIDRARVQRVEASEDADRWPANILLDPYAAGLLDAKAGEASRFFYVAKPDGGERNAGLDDDGDAGNFHPTVKPVDLMAYLIQLVTRPGGVVLDPFMGSGTTAIAAARHGFTYVGCEKSPEYLALAEKRVAAETAQGLLL